MSSHPYTAYNDLRDVQWKAHPKRMLPSDCAACMGTNLIELTDQACSLLEQILSDPILKRILREERPDQSPFAKERLIRRKLYAQQLEQVYSRLDEAMDFLVGDCWYHFWRLREVAKLTLIGL